MAKPHFEDAASPMLTTRELYDRILVGYRQIPNNVKADVALALIEGPEFSRCPDGNAITPLTERNPLIANNLTLAVAEMVEPGAERNTFLARVRSHPMMEYLKDYAPQESAYYSRAFQTLADGGVMQDRINWQDGVWRPYRRAFWGRKNAGNPMTDVELVSHVYKMVEHPALSLQGSRYDELDARVALAHQLPPGIAHDFVRAHVIDTPVRDALYADSPRAGKYFDEVIRTDFGAWAMTKPQRGRQIAITL